MAFLDSKFKKKKMALAVPSAFIGKTWGKREEKTGHWP